MTLVGHILSVGAMFAWGMVLIAAPVVYLAAALIEGLDPIAVFAPVVEFVTLNNVAAAVVGTAVLWSVGRTCSPSLPTGTSYWDGWGANEFPFYFYFEGKARGGKRRSWLLVWLGALLDGVLLLPNSIAALGVLAYVLIRGAIALVLFVSLILAMIAVAGVVLWWLGCAFFITCL